MSCGTWEGIAPSVLSGPIRVSGTLRATAHRNLPSARVQLGLEQVGDPHDRYCGALVRGTLHGVLGTGPDIILLCHKFLAILHESELPLRDVTDHGIFHRIGAEGAAGLENYVA